MRYSRAVADNADNSDWRVTITLADPAHLERAKKAFSVRRVEADVRRKLGGNIALGSNDTQIFLYAGSEIAVTEAANVAREVLADEGLPAQFDVHNWHPIEEEWERPDVMLPRTDEERRAEHQCLEDDETTESLASGLAGWEARAAFGSHHEAVAMAARLRGEGLANVRRWRFLVVFANNEDDATAVADRIRREAPADATVTVQAARPSIPFLPW